MPSKSKKLFDAVLLRADDLRSLGNYLAKEKVIPKEQTTRDFHGFEDMGRAAIVLAVSAMDQYFTRRFAELLVPFLKKEGATDALVAILSDSGFDTREALNAISMRRPYRRIRTLVEARFETYTTQKFVVIDELFLAIGLKDFTANCQKKTKRKTLLSSVSVLVDRRHKIAHGGDLNSHGKLRQLDFKDLKKRLKDLETFVSAAEAIIENRTK